MCISQQILQTCSFITVWDKPLILKRFNSRKIDLYLSAKLTKKKEDPLSMMPLMLYIVESLQCTVDLVKFYTSESMMTNRLLYYYLFLGSLKTMADLRKKIDFIGYNSTASYILTITITMCVFFHFVHACSLYTDTLKIYYILYWEKTWNCSKFL